MKTALVLAALCLPACTRAKEREKAGDDRVPAEVVKLDGSSTVFPISQAVAEEFQKEKGGKVTVGVSGTGGGFKKFCRGEIAIAGASRPIKDEEAAQCKEGGIDYIELPIAFDGLAVVVHGKNDWARDITVAELKTIWAPEAQGKVTKWSQVRKGWPDRDLHLFGPGVDSGTYDYFTQAIVGKEHSSRGDFTSSEDDNVLVQGVSTDEGGMGFFGYAYYAENQDKLKLVPVDGGKGPVAPTPETVENGSYQPLSRPIFIYVSTREMDRPEVKAYVEYYLTKGPELVKEVGYIALPANVYALAQKRFADKKTGSAFHGSKVGMTAEELMK
jgi:phosphate transport system substrate-binding protein